MKPTDSRIQEAGRLMAEANERKDDKALSAAYDEAARGLAMAAAAFRKLAQG